MSQDKLKLGVMGWPVRQSRSPELFYETFAGRPDVLDHFSYDLLEESDFDRAYERFDREYYAVNVTIPYKEPAFRAAEEASALCRTVGAANLLLHQDGRVVAHNTDIIAVTEILRNHLPGHIREQEGPICTPRPKVLVVGCGGAGKAAAAAAISIGASVTIANRTAETAIGFIDKLLKNSRNLTSGNNSHTPSTQKTPDNSSFDRSIRTNLADTAKYAPLSTLHDEVRRADFIIYTLPVAVPELDHCDFNGKTILEAKYYDTSIKPAPGMTYIPGTEWLRLQALATYRILGILK